MPAILPSSKCLFPRKANAYARMIAVCRRAAPFIAEYLRRLAQYVT
jgi:hypothetical protein